MIDYKLTDDTKILFTILKYETNIFPLDNTNLSTFSKAEIDMIQQEFPNMYIDKHIYHLESFGRKIYKLEDDWFILGILSGYGIPTLYKCDQIDGLIECLKQTNLSLNQK